MVGRGGTVSVNGLPPGDFPPLIFDTMLNGIPVSGSIVGTHPENINVMFARMNHGGIEGRIVIGFAK